MLMMHRMQIPAVAAIAVLALLPPVVAMAQKPEPPAERERCETSVGPHQPFTLE